MKMRGAVLYEQGLPRPYTQSNPLVIETIDLDGPKQNEILVEIRAAGLCHSDMSTIEGIRTRPIPTVLGHEAAGIVREVGPGVKDLKEGDHVVMVFVMSCGKCYECTTGRPHLCGASFESKMKGELVGGGKRMSVNGNPISHAAGISCFAEYAVVDRSSVVKLPEDITFEDAALFGCAVITGVGAVTHTAKAKPGEPVAVFGLGGVGLSAVMGAALSGAEPIVAVDLNEEKMALAKTLGAHFAVNASEGTERTAEKIKDLTGGGVIHAIELSGTVKGMEAAYASLRSGGTVTVAGLTPADAVFELKPYMLTAKEFKIQGCYMGSCSPPRDMPRFVDYYRDGKLPVDKLRTGELGLDGINEGFENLAAGTAIRQILKPHG
ncbi:MAG: zinc-dependent alcohol dehydrogenase family protein [Rhodospirillales bacterium]|nr:zinc-dependent alcohol dehydrogenase family protein [Rhodospirillales bacterium]